MFIFLTKVFVRIVKLLLPCRSDSNLSLNLKITIFYINLLHTKIRRKML